MLFLLPLLFSPPFSNTEFSGDPYEESSVEATDIFLCVSAACCGGKRLSKNGVEYQQQHQHEPVRQCEHCTSR